MVDGSTALGIRSRLEVVGQKVDNVIGSVWLGLDSHATVDPDRAWLDGCFA